MALSKPFGDREHIQHEPMIGGRGLGKGAARRDETSHGPRERPRTRALIAHPAQQQATDEKPSRFADRVVIVLRRTVRARGADALRMEREQFTRAGAQPAIRTQQRKGQADADRAQRRFLRTGPSWAAKGRVGGSPIGQKRLGLVQMTGFGLSPHGHGKAEQGGKAMGLPKRADILPGAGQHIQRMGFRAEGAVPVTLG